MNGKLKAVAVAVMTIGALATSCGTAQVTSHQPRCHHADCGKGH